VLTQDIFDIYWKYYPKYREKEKPYTSLKEFLVWLPENISSIELLHKFDADRVLESIKRYQSVHRK